MRRADEGFYRISPLKNIPRFHKVIAFLFVLPVVLHSLSRPSFSDETGYTYNANNEILTSPHATYKHDENGNMIEKIENGITTTYAYDIENRLVRVTDTAGLNAVYYYDPFGKRLWKEVNGVRTYFMYADEGLIAEINAAGQVIKTYGYAPDSTWGTNPIWMRVMNSATEPSGYYLFHNDQLGTPQKLAAPNGAVVWSATYESFGKATVNPASTVINNFRFPGQYFDLETGLHYNWHRYYDPSTGRYTVNDPQGSLSEEKNLYPYADGNPTKNIDPYGLFAAPVPGVSSPLPPMPNNPNDSGACEKEPPAGRGCKFIGERNNGGPCKACMYQCKGYGIATFGQAMGKSCGPVKPDGQVDLSGHDPKCLNPKGSKP